MKICGTAGYGFKGAPKGSLTLILKGFRVKYLMEMNSVTTGLRSPLLRKPSRFFRNRRGQTLVEYALLLAYISVVCMQVMSLMGFVARKQYMYVTAVAIVAKTNNQNISAAANRAAEMSAVASFLSQSSNWGNVPASWASAGYTEVYNKIYAIVYSS